MVLAEQYILLKKTRSGAQQWRQYNLMTNQQGTKWYIKEFTGRSKRSIKFKVQYEFGWPEEAKLDINNLIENRRNEGYILYDRVIEDMVDTPFSKLNPIRNVVMNIGKATSANFLDDNTHRLIPVFGGVHCCIKIGFDTVFHVEAKTSNNNNVPLPEDVMGDLVEMVKLSEYETFVLEAFVTKTKVTFVDILCVNGVVCKKPLTQRMALLGALKGDDESFTQLKKPSQTNLLPTFKNNDQLPYWYAVKSVNQNANPLETVTYLVPQYYVFNVMVSKVRDDILEFRDKKQRLKLLVSDVDQEGGHKLIEVGELILPMSFPSHRIKCVESVGINNGKLIKPRVCATKYGSSLLARSSVNQFKNLAAHWAANLS